jgi:hypothetical protein
MEKRDGREAAVCFNPELLQKKYNYNIFIIPCLNLNTMKSKVNQIN